MSFPESERVIYDKNPLIDVVCQLRFPSILRIDAESPTSFQEAIREDYPLYEEVLGADLVTKMLPDLVRLMGRDVQFPGGKTYQFSTDDQLWRLTLTRDFLALTCNKYERWEDFRKHLDRPIEALIKAYKPAFFTRIGLRYRDIISRDKLGLKGYKWSQILRPHIAGELASDIAENVVGISSEVVIRLEDTEGRVHLRHGLVQDAQTQELCYLIDADHYFEGRVKTPDAYRYLDQFNSTAGRLFRWCIQDDLNRAMGPRPVPRYIPED